MRNPKRLDNFYETVKEIHKKEFPDWRFGQLMSNFFGWLWNKHKIDLFFLEEPMMLAYFKEFAGVYKPEGEEVND